MHVTHRRTTWEQNMERVVRVVDIVSTTGRVHDGDVLELALLYHTILWRVTTLDVIEHQFGETMRALVAEMCEFKQASTRDQVAKAASLSRAVRIVLLAEYIDYASQKIIDGPVSACFIEHYRGHVAWSCAIVHAGGRGVCPLLEYHFNALLDREFTDTDGKRHVVLRKDMPLETQVDMYHALVDEGERIRQTIRSLDNE